MSRKPSLLLLTAIAATLSTVAHAVSAASPALDTPATRLGTAINQDLATRDQATARRNRALVLREQVAKATEERLKADLRARQEQADLAASAGTTGSAAEAQYDNLARIYQAMKPAKAALVFEQLDMDVQMKVAQRMRDRSTAMILAAMTPNGATDLSMSLARKAPKKKAAPTLPASSVPRAAR
jgi:flagellar motility protein MotE (MotC chaperone)